MSFLRRAIDRQVETAATEAVKRHLASPAFTTLLDDIIRSNPVFQFRKAAQASFLTHAPKLTPREAWDHAGRVLGDYLRDEKIEFGDPRYDWSAGGAADLVNEEMRHWEAA